MKGISGNKDIDREILFRVADEDLIHTSQMNSYIYHTICNEQFFKERLLRTYPCILEYYEIYESYKECFVKIIPYIIRLRKYYHYNYLFGDPKKQYEVLQRSWNDKCMLIEAVKEGELALIIEAVKRGADISANCNYVLRSAAFNGHLDIVKYCVEEKRIAINVEYNFTVEYASVNGFLDMVKYAVEKGADIHTGNDMPLRKAAIQGHLPVVKYLVEQKANIHAENDHAIKCARVNNHIDVLNYLTEQANIKF